MKQKKRVCSLVENMPPSGIRAFFDLVLAMKDVISLGVGEPDFVTPWNIREAGISCLEKGMTSYTSNKGMMKLRLCIEKFLKRELGLDYDPKEEILITTGVSQGFDLAVRAIIEAGDEVLIPTPCYVAYAPLAALAGGKPKCIRTSLKDSFRLTPEMIDSECTSRTKAIVFNYPANPTGTSYTKSELSAIAKVLKKRNLIVISDEVYWQLSYEYRHTALPSLPAMKERTIYLNGFSKGFAMTGWRIAYACGPKDIIAAMTKIHQYSMLCAPIMSQLAAVEALEGSQKAVSEMVREYTRRKEFLFDALKGLGFLLNKPQGAFYLFPCLKPFKMSGEDFANGLLKEQKVAVVPGSAFGPGLEDFIRISYATSFSSLKEAVSRISSFLKKRKLV